MAAPGVAAGLVELARAARQQDRDLFGLERMAQAVGRDAQQKLAGRVGEEGLGELRQRGEVAALGLDEPKALARKGGEVADQQSRDEEDEEGGDVAGVLNRERVNGWQEEEVEAESRQHGGERAGAALPDPRTDEDSQQQHQRDGRVGKIRRKELQQADRREDDENGGGVARPAVEQSTEHGVWCQLWPCGRVQRALARRVLQDARLLERDEAFGHHLVEDGQEPVDVRRRVDDLDDDRQVLREPQDVRRVKDAARSESGRALKDGGSGEAFPPEPLEERRRQRLVMPAVRLADEDADQDLLSVEDAHGFSFSGRRTAARPRARPRRRRDIRRASGRCWQRRRAALRPADTAASRN